MTGPQDVRPSTTATAPGKIILAGEHAVVYGRPAIAIPIRTREATVTVHAAEPGTGCRLVAPQIDLDARLAALPADQPLALVVRLALTEAGVTGEPDLRIDVSSTLPIAGGLGSGAAICTALARAVLTHLDRAAPPALISEMVYAGERIYHGTPSGIDNTVIAYEMPVWFVKGQQPARFGVKTPVTLVIGDSGQSAYTREAVAHVRQQWELEPERYEALFDAIALVVHRMRASLERGDGAELGNLFNQNQHLLCELGVSSARLDHLIHTARQSGATGAKLSGAGWGGNLIALTTPDHARSVAEALLAAGAHNALITTLPVTQP